MAQMAVSKKKCSDTVIHIDKEGFLMLCRAGFSLKYVFCPHQPTARCGLWCALFGEPRLFVEPTSSGAVELVSIELCIKTIQCEANNFTF